MSMWKAKNASLQAALEQGVPKVVHTSSEAALGCHGRDCLAKEDAEFNAWKTGAHYNVLRRYLAEVEPSNFAERAACRCRQSGVVMVYRTSNYRLAG